MFDLKESDCSVILQPDGNVRYEKAKPLTNRDALLQRWAKDVESMAKALVERDLEDGGYFFHSATTKSGTGYTQFYQIALQEEIAYLNSPYKEATDD